MLDNKKLIGRKVVRGPNWRWRSQDEYNGVQQKGTIIEIDSDPTLDTWILECKVVWEGSKNSFHYSLNEKHIKLLPEHIMVQEEFEI